MQMTNRERGWGKCETESGDGANDKQGAGMVQMTNRDLTRFGVRKHVFSL